MASRIPSAPATVASRTTSKAPSRKLSWARRRLVVIVFISALRFQRIIERLSAIIPHLLVDLTLEGSLERVRRIHYLRDFVYVILQHRIQRRVSNPHLHAHSNIKIIGYSYLHTNVLYRRRITR